MRVTLKRAAAYERAALKAATEMKHDMTIELSIHSPTLDATDTFGLTGVIGEAREKLLDRLALSLVLIEAVYAIREQLDVANATFGVSANVTRNVALIAKEARLRAIIKQVEDVRKLSESDPRTILAKAKSMREQGATDRYRLSREDDITVALIDEVTETMLRDQLKQIVDARGALNDALTVANVTNHIDLSEDTVAALRRGNILPS